MQARAPTGSPLGVVLAVDLDDLGVDDHDGAVALVEVVGEEALAHPDLGGGQADALFDTDGGVHAVDERDEIAGDLLYFARGWILQHGVAEEPQHVTGHGLRLPDRVSERNGQA